MHGGRADACALRRQVWACQNVARQFKQGDISPPVHASFNKEVFEIGDALKKIFAASFQVLPFLYTHMVSLSCTIYLLGSAFLRGAAFTPESDIAGGLVIPLIYVLLTNLTIYGLLCVGDTVFDPFGDDYEDFAVLRFVEHTATASYEAIYCDPWEPSEEYTRAWQERKDKEPKSAGLKVLNLDAGRDPTDLESISTVGARPPFKSASEEDEKKQRLAAHMKGVRARKGSVAADA